MSWLIRCISRRTLLATPDAREIITMVKAAGLNKCPMLKALLLHKFLVTNSLHWIHGFVSSSFTNILWLILALASLLFVLSLMCCHVWNLLFYAFIIKNFFSISVKSIVCLSILLRKQKFLYIWMSPNAGNWLPFLALTDGFVGRSPTANLDQPNRKYILYFLPISFFSQKKFILYLSSNRLFNN